MLILSVFCYIIRAINYVFVVLKVMLYMSDRLIDNKELMKEWNQEKNILYNPADLTSGSSKKVWWKCKNGHEWEAVIHTRVKGVGCPYCMGKKAIQGVNDFATLYPEMLKEWDYEENDKLGIKPNELLVGSINIIIAFIICVKYKEWIAKSKIVKKIVIVFLAISIVLVFTGDVITNKIEDGLYRDKIILSKQTKYQKIVVTRHKDDLRLFLDGNIQFSSADEYRYHEALVHIPFLYTNSHERVLILGGGDGLAAREVLKYDDVKEIVLVDLDKEMTDLCSEDNFISQLNNNSLKSDKLTIINEDAYLYVTENEEPFDIIIIDLPDPNNEALNKLYTNVFYNYIRANLKDTGVMVVQSTSPYYAKNSFWCINKTIKTQFDYVIPYHVQVPSFGEWGFNMASKQNLTRSELKVDTKYLNSENINNLFQ